MSVAGLSYTACNPDELTARAKVVAGEATCRTVDAAIVGYLGLHGQEPASIADLAGYVKGDISAYQIVGGVAVGPGC